MFRKSVNRIVCVNNGGFIQKFRARWENGNSSWSSNYPNPQSREWDLNRLNIPEGARVCIEVKAILGTTCSSEPVIYQRDSDNVALYRTVGTTLHFQINLEN